MLHGYIKGVDGNVPGRMFPQREPEAAENREESSRSWIIPEPAAESLQGK